MSIPGQSAPASLKPDHDYKLLSGNVRHSGAVCPGLIEARFERSACPAWRGRIPGQSAPASLKPMPRSHPQHLAGRIPGQSAPASLKLEH